MISWTVTWKLARQNRWQYGKYWKPESKFSAAWWSRFDQVHMAGKPSETQPAGCHQQ